MARRLHGLEVEVRGADLRPQQTDEYLPDIQTLEALPDLLAATDVLVICCPATEATHHLVDAEVLAALPRGAYLITFHADPSWTQTRWSRRCDPVSWAAPGSTCWRKSPLRRSIQSWELPKRHTHAARWRPVAASSGARDRVRGAQRAPVQSGRAAAERGGQAGRVLKTVRPICLLPGAPPDGRGAA